MNYWIGFVAKSAVAGLAIAFVAVAVRPSLLGQGETGTVRIASFADAVERTAPAVVNIYSAEPDDGAALIEPQYPRRSTTARRVTSLGSGVILSSDGYIVTNDHVVTGRTDLFVSLLDGRVAKAEIVGTDPDTDLALLLMDSKNLPTMPLGRSDEMRTGDIVIAIGNPFGIGQTVTQGIVSATGRDQLGLNDFEDFIQTDAAINPGNSGGALVNVKGELVGINTAIVSGSGSEGISFAIPVNLVSGVVAQLIENGRVVRGWLGVRAENLPPQLAGFLGLPAGGIILKGVYANTPAERAGLKRGDVITAVNREPIIQLKDALHRVARTQPGATITLSGLHQNGQPFEIATVVMERPTPQVDPSPPRGS